MIEVYNDDCITARKFSDGIADLVICDPPFGLGEDTFDKHYHRDPSLVLKGYVTAPKDYLQFTKEWLKEAYRMLKADGSMYIVSGWSKLKEVLQACGDIKLHIINHIIWERGFGVYTKNKFVSSHFHVLYLSKKKSSKVTFNRECRFVDFKRDDKGKALQYADRSDVWHINRDYQTGKVKNQNKLPDELVRKMIQYSSNDGDVVLDMFMGNFTTAEMALELKRTPIGYEINKIAYDYHMQRLRRSFI